MALTLTGNNIQEINLIKSSLKNFIASVDYTENQDYIDENKNDYFYVKDLITKLDENYIYTSKDLEIIKAYLKEYIFDLDEKRYEVQIQLDNIIKQKSSIYLLINKL
jgi:hypothetical protein